MSLSSNDSAKKLTRTRERKPRGRGLRTRTGCLTCRKRHLKCNEAKPVCGPCTRSNHSCVYADPCAPHPDSTSASTSNSASKQPSTTPSLSNSVAPSVITNPDLEYPDTPEGFDLALRTTWSHRNSPCDDPAQLVSRASIWQARNARLTSAPHSVNGTEYDRMGGMAAHWTPLLEDLDSTRFSPGPPSLHSEMMSPSVPYGHSYGPVTYARSRTGSEDLPITSHPASSRANPDAAVAKWFGQLVGDTDLQHEGPRPDADWVRRRRSISQTQQPEIIDLAQNFAWEGRQYSPHPIDASAADPGISSGRVSEDPAQGLESPPPWRSKAALTMKPREVEIFDNFVARISRWLDLFDPMQNFSTHVPHLAMHNFGLLNAILALSICHLSLTPRRANNITLNRTDAVQYYHEALRYIQDAMRHDSYNRSDELLATCLIISAYEMIDGSRKDWERHLQGFYRLQRSQLIHGESKGIKQAVWWAWLGQDIWAAFREKRKPYTSWHPTKDYANMNPYEFAARSVHLMAKVVSYCSQSEIEQGELNFKSRVAKADHLSSLLDEWHRHLPMEFNPLPISAEADGVFKPIWVHPPAFSKFSEPQTYEYDAY
ncbi:uncharacterized protein A1O9_03442 [Exophiala aquamarina CBS 119918]|uniref:Zn(2)-C6 fungal-type domain-containing protein n=1 Tax=Exophiala aquamarina CBS 119918 TaxID=1182545 RepID=A0A072Q1W3_9EURO|nr:uncharacterized protein A1O9_03442 [Exophiala aquamarina CBS 119918]KEF61870.1 hypothetical protein A1O9_03442 [Exophiala aquamarina CBS 119918]